jgi:hypothetical protein
LAYIGNIPAESYASFETETFSVSATTNYTLSHAVTNENEIRLVINGVVQQPGSGKAYTASGTTLTLTSATVSGDVMYAVYLGRALQTINPPNASVGLSQLSATGTKNSTTFLRGDNTFAVAGGENTPNFRAYVSSSQSISANTATKIDFDTEAWDVGSKFDTSNNRFTPGEAGYFFLYANVFVSAFSDQNSCNISIVKNGSTDTVYHRYRASGTANASINLSDVVYSSNATDYFEVNINNQDACNVLDRTDYSYFGGYKLIGV